MKNITIKGLQKIPGIGPSISKNLFDIGIRSISDLKNNDPELLYEKSSIVAGHKQDRCLLHVFRCAVYYASHKKHDSEKLKWWNWKDYEFA